MIIDEEDYLLHYGILRKSGRYPWGSGETIPERSRDYLSTVKQLADDGMSEVEIAKAFGMTTTELRAAKTIARNQAKQADINFAQRLKDKGYSNVAIGKRMGISESSVRALLKPGEQQKTDQLTAISEMLKREVADKGFIDVGKGVENRLSIKRTQLDTAIAMLKEDGEYTLHVVQTPQLSGGGKTYVKVLAPPGITYTDVVKNMDKIRNVGEYSDDGGSSFLHITKPLSIDSKRVGINYAETGGSSADGVVYVRPGVPDVSLGGVRYAQVRISVDGTHFIKGMAVYKDDLPEGVDLLFNTSKKDTGNKFDALKPMKTISETDKTIDQDNPFGSIVRPSVVFKDASGKDISGSVMNIVNEEGDWDEWSKNLSSQMLGKQSKQLAKQQLNKTYASLLEELDTIANLTNPVVKRKLLLTYADSVDSAAVKLKAAALPRQRSQVILPMNSMKVTEVYAPNYNHGERVVLIRYPHGGIFEIPELVVNNRNPTAKKILGDAKDAIGIHSKVAERLSGADFDGDTVLVIPNETGAIRTSPALEGLKGFDPKQSYPYYEGMKVMSDGYKQTQMGVVSNLITDMTLKGARPDEIARAVRHSMVVIDAPKHKLDYRQSAIDNGIAGLRKKYQARPEELGGPTAGASTLLSLAKSKKDIPKRKLRNPAQGGPIDPETGKLVWVPTNETTVKKGVVVPKTQKIAKLADTDDAYTLSSGLPMEAIYADHSNRLKALANAARKEYLQTRPNPMSDSAKAVYVNEVASLNAKLNVALKNAPLERRAQILGNSIVDMKRAANPDMSEKEIQKLKYLALAEARKRMNVSKVNIDITAKEWEAIQAGAISTNVLSKIIDNTNLDRLKELAMPRETILMTPANLTRARSMLANGYAQGDVAKALGVSLSTLKNSIEAAG